MDMANQKFYCVKEDGAWLTKGKVYTADDKGRLIYDDEWMGYEYPTVEEFRHSNPIISKFLFPLVDRPAKVGEWVYVTDGDGHLAQVGDTYEVLGTREADSSWVYVGPVTGMLLRGYQYLVLDGYKPEPQEKKTLDGAPEFKGSSPVPAPTQPSYTAILDTVKEITSNEREYGTPEDFKITAELWETYLKTRCAGIVIEPHDVAMLVCLLKIAQTVNSDRSKL